MYQAAGHFRRTHWEEQKRATTLICLKMVSALCENGLHPPVYCMNGTVGCIDGLQISFATRLGSLEGDIPALLLVLLAL